MDTNLPPAVSTIDVTGLPEPVVQGIRQLVRTIRDELAGGKEILPPIQEPRKSFIGSLEHLNLKTPTLEEFQEARREMWANFPREFPDTAK